MHVIYIVYIYILNVVYTYMTYIVHIYSVYVYAVSMLYMYIAYTCCVYILRIYGIYPIFSTSRLICSHRQIYAYCIFILPVHNSYICCIYVLYMHIIYIYIYIAYVRAPLHSMDWTVHCAVAAIFLDPVCVKSVYRGQRDRRRISYFTKTYSQPTKVFSDDFCILRHFCIVLPQTTHILLVEQNIALLICNNANKGE